MPSRLRIWYTRCQPLSLIRLGDNQHGSNRYWRAPAMWERLVADAAENKEHGLRKGDDGQHSTQFLSTSAEAPRSCKCRRANRRPLRDNPWCERAPEFWHLKAMERNLAGPSSAQRVGQRAEQRTS